MKYFLLCVLCASLLDFALMGVDKWKARHNRWRVPERAFFCVALLGGTPGALLGMWTFRHKTRHLLRPVETVGNRGHVLPHPAHQAGEGGAVHGPLRVEGGQLRPGPGQIGEDDGGGGGAAARPLLPQIGKPVLIRPVGHGPVRAGDIHPRGMGDGNMRAQGHICLSMWVDCAQYNTRRPARQRLSFRRGRAILSGYETKRSVPPCPSSLSPREMSGGR